MVPESKPPIVAMDDVPTYRFEPKGGSDRFGAAHAKLGLAVGAEKLGATLSIIDPGKRAYPRHAHWANEEMMIILEGSGWMHLGDQTFPVTAGDVCSARAGGPETAHCLEASADGPLKVIAISTMIEPEINLPR